MADKGNINYEQTRQMSTNTKAIKNFGETSLMFGGGLFLDCLSHATTDFPEDASLLGLSPHVLRGILTLGSHVMAHGIFEGWKETKETFKNDLNSHLENAISNAYKKSFTEIRTEIIREYKLNESKKDWIFRYLFKKENPDQLALKGLDKEFLNPLLESLTNNETIARMLTKNEQLQPDDYLLKLIKKVTPEYYKKQNVLLKSFTTEFIKKLKKHYKHNFLQELKEEDKAKTVYFTHLLESILNKIDKIDDLCKTHEILRKNILVLQEFAKESGVSLFKINEKISLMAFDVTEIKKDVKTLLYKNTLNKDFKSDTSFFPHPRELSELNLSNNYEKYFESEIKTMDELKVSYYKWEDNVKTRLIKLFLRETSSFKYTLVDGFTDYKTYKIGLDSNTNEKKQTYKFEINSVGRIQCLVIEIPESIAPKLNFEIIGQKMKNCVLTEYQNFKHSLLKKVHIYESVLTEALYEIVNDALSHAITNKFKGKYYFTITQINNRNETKCIYSLNSEALGCLINILEAEKTDSDRSIIERVIDFVSIHMEDVILPMTRFEKSYFAELEKFALDVQNQLMTYHKILEVEKAFYKGKRSLVYIDKLVEYGSYIVEINASGLLSEYFEELKKDKEFQDVINRKFAENVNKFLKQYNEGSILTQIFLSNISLTKGSKLI